MAFPHVLPSHIVILSVSEGSSIHLILKILRVKALRMTERGVLTLQHLTSSSPSPRKRRMPLSGGPRNDSLSPRHPRAGGDPEPPANAHPFALRRSKATIERAKPFKSSNELSVSRLGKINPRKKYLKLPNELNKTGLWENQGAGRTGRGFCRIKPCRSGLNPLKRARFKNIITNG